VAPPSIDMEGRSYQFLRGDLAQVKNLPAMRSVDLLIRGRLPDGLEILRSEAAKRT